MIRIIPEKQPIPARGPPAIGTSVLGYVLQNARRLGRTPTTPKTDRRGGLCAGRTLTVWRSLNESAS